MYEWRPKNTAFRSRIVAKATSGKYKSMACIAREIGLTTERVRQILREEGATGFRKRQPNTLISWPCPRCGAEVKMWTNYRNSGRTTYCVPCAREIGTEKRRGRKDRPRMLCTQEGCSREKRHKGLCDTHYMRSKSGYPLDIPIPANNHAKAFGCQEEGCDHDHFSRGYCRACYHRRKRNRLPLGDYLTKRVPKEDA